MGPPSLVRGAAITQSASTVTVLGSSESSSSRSEADPPSDESFVQRLSSEARRPSTKTFATPGSAAPRTPLRVASPSPPPSRGATTPRGAASSRAGTPRQRHQRRQDGKETGDEGVREEVKVVVRVRPPIEKDQPLSYFADETDVTKLLSSPPEGVVGPGNRALSGEEFGFSRVISPAEDNRRAFETLGLAEMIGGVSQGFQETIFAYGQTGSGKTHTILGSGRADLLLDSMAGDCLGSTGGQQRTVEPGLLQLCTRELFNTVFNSSSDNQSRKYIQLMCLEIKNEEIIDLLHSSCASTAASAGGATSAPGGATPRSVSGTSTPRSVPGRRGALHTTQETLTVRGKRCTYGKVTTWSYDETMWLLREAIASREVGTSSLNSASSRSHMVIRFFVKTLAVPDADGVVPASQINANVMGSLTLVDLAGNERDIMENVIRKGESKAINVSLTHLNRMLLKMQNGQLDESDRRQSTLNMILYDSLQQDCGTTMIFCIHPDCRFHSSARSTLQMALRCRRIVRQKRVRRIEPAGQQGELADLRVAASALTHAHKQALEARLCQEAELQRMAQLLQEVRQQYTEEKRISEEKLRDCDVPRSNLETRYEHLSTGSSGDLERRDSEFTGESNRHSKKTLVDEEILRQVELARHRDNQGFEDRCQALEMMYKTSRDELRSVKEAHQKELRSLKDALQQQGIAAEASPRTTPRTTPRMTPRATPPASSAGEPCSEPSMQSHSSRDKCFGDEENHLASHRRIQQVPTPQHFGARRRSASNREEAESGRTSPRWHRSGVEVQVACQDGKPASSIPKVEKVLTLLQHALGQESQEAEPFDTQPMEAAEAQLGQLCKLVVQARIEPEDHEAMGLRWSRQCVEMGLEAARRFGSSLKIRRDVAKLLLEISNRDASMKEEMIAKGAIPLTIDTLNFLLSLFASSSSVQPDTSTASFAGEVCSASFRLLAALCQRHRGQQSTSHAALDAILRCLAVPQLRDTDSPINGCYLIMTLVDKQPTHQELVRTIQFESDCSSVDAAQSDRCDGIKLLLQLLDAEVIAVENEAARRPADVTCDLEQASATLCYYIVGSLAKVVQDNEKNQKALYAIGGINLLLRTLKTCMQSGEVVGNACMAIAFTAHRHPPSQLAAGSQGAVELILDALVAYRGESPVQIGVCRAIATLTERSSTNQQAFLRDMDCETGVVALLFQALSDDPSGEPLVTTMCWALSNLTVGNADALDHVNCLGGLDIVVTLLKRFAKEERACEYLCRLLTELVRGESSAAQRNRQDLRALGAKEAITAMAQHHAQSEGFVLVRVRDALQNLNVQ